MRVVQPCALPPAALLRNSLDQGAYADCFVTEVPLAVSHAEFVEAFYTTAVFGIERWILRWALSRPSTHDEARQLAIGARDAFAAWTVLGRATDQLHLADVTGRTQSWLMVAPVVRVGSHGTRLYFGSAVMPRRRRALGPAEMGFVFRALLGFHKLYSRVLLSAARSRVLALKR